MKILKMYLSPSRDALILIMISFLYPLKWDGILISCVPKELVHVILEAPCSSMFIGVLKDSFQSCFECYVDVGHPFEDDLWIVDLTLAVPKLKKLASQKYQSVRKAYFYEKWLVKRTVTSPLQQNDWETLPYGERLAHKLHWCRNKKNGPFAIRFSFLCLVLGILQNHSKYISYSDDQQDFNSICIDVDGYLYREGVSESWKPFFRKFLKGTIFLRFLIERAENHESFDFYEEISGRDLDDLWRDAYFHTLETYYCHNSVIQKFSIAPDINLCASGCAWDNSWINEWIKSHFAGDTGHLNVLSIRPRSKSNSIEHAPKVNVPRLRSRTIMIARRAPSRQNALTTSCAVARFMIDIFLIWLKIHFSLLTFDSAYQAWTRFCERIYCGNKIVWIPSISKIYNILAALTEPGSKEDKALVKELFQTYGRKIVRSDAMTATVPPIRYLKSTEFSMICMSCGGEHSFMDYLMSLGLEQISCRFCSSKVSLEPFVNGRPLLIPNFDEKMMSLLHPETLSFLMSLIREKISASVLKFHLYFPGYLDSDSLMMKISGKESVEFLKNALLSLKSHLYGQAIKHLLFSRKTGATGSVASQFSLFWLLASLNELDFERGETLYKIASPRIPLSRLLREYLKIICYIEPCLLHFYDPLIDAAPSFVSISVYSQFYGYS